MNPHMPTDKDKKKFKSMIAPYLMGKFEEFVQVECGYRHTLLLNNCG